MFDFTFQSTGKRKEKGPRLFLNVLHAPDQVSALFAAQGNKPINFTEGNKKLIFYNFASPPPSPVAKIAFAMIF